MNDEPLEILPPESEPASGAALVVPERTTLQTLASGLPKIGEWFWVRVEEDPEDTMYIHRGRSVSKRRGKKRKAKPKFREYLMCVEHVASNHIRFAHYRGKYHYNEDVSFQQLMTDCRPEPNWKSVWEQRLEDTRAAMEEATKKLYDESVAKNALPASDPQPFNPTAEGAMLPAIRVLDPAKQKRDLLALKKRIPEVVKSVGELAEEYANISSNLVLSELSNLRAMQTKLGIVEDKIFTLEVYAGLQEQVKQIAIGDGPKPDTKITVRQSLLFMDEETLFDYRDGGMDYRKLEDFDKWIARRENLDRCLPEPRGIVAFRIRRDPKDYGESRTLLEAFVKMEMNKENMKTYLLIRNGGNVYRIASAVDFSPRLIPLATEFDDAFTETERISQGTWVGKGADRRYIDGEEITKRIGPDDFRYDEEAEQLRNKLKHYNRVVVLLQGLLDRSEVFHPHLPINLATERDISEWLNLVRDEEGALTPGSMWETFEEYRDRLNRQLQRGDMIYRSYLDGRRRHWNTKQYPPSIVAVKKIRKGNKGDIVPDRHERYGREWRTVEGRPEKECVGIPGVEIEWDGGEATIYPRDRWRGSYKKQFRYQMWIPLDKVFNVTGYRPGDFKRFLCDRSQKGAYLKWAGPLLGAEGYHRRGGKLREDEEASE